MVYDICSCNNNIYHKIPYQNDMNNDANYLVNSNIYLDDRQGEYVYPGNSNYVNNEIQTKM